MFPDCSRTSQTQATCSCVKPNEAILPSPHAGLELLLAAEAAANAAALEAAAAAATAATAEGEPEEPPAP